MEKPNLRVLIVDDFQPWRQFLRSTLQKFPQFRIIGEESDGLSAVHSAEQLKPDLIILDISLPTLHGIEAARRIRRISPNSRILFASADRSLETVDAALDTGAGGYLVKTDGGSELLTAIEAVLQGRAFVSSGVVRERAAQAAKQSLGRLGPDVLPASPTRIVRHEVDFYPDDMALVNGFSHAIGSALKAGAVAIVIATAAHHAQILERLMTGVDMNAEIERGSYLHVNAADALEMIMNGAMPDAARCSKLLADLIAKTSRAANGKGARVAICGECAPGLLQRGNVEAAVQLEHIWGKIAKQHDADTLCGYLWNAFPEGENSVVFRRICDEHSVAHGRRADQNIS